MEKFGCGRAGSVTGGMRAQIGAPVYAAGLGKGLREPVSPYREAYFFGAELNTPNADNWNYYPQILEPGTAYNLSSIAPNHEVLVQLAVFFNLTAAGQVRIDWRRSTGEIFYSHGYLIPSPADYGYAEWLWYYVYSYIGYVPWEIYSNGTYYVDVYFNNQKLQTTPFTVTGITVETGEWFAFSNKPTLRLSALVPTGSWYAFTHKPVLAVNTAATTGSWYTFMNKPHLAVTGVPGAPGGGSIVPLVVAGIGIIAVAAAASSSKVRNYAQETVKKASSAVSTVAGKYL